MPFLETTSAKTYYEKHGSGSQTMVFLHGWGGSTTSFHSLANKIATKNKITCIVLDLPGFGKSSPPPKKGWQVSDYEQWLENVLKKLKIKKACFYGHSFGCRVLVHFLLGKEKNIAEKVILTGAAGIKWPLSSRQKLSVFLSKKFKKAKSLIPRSLQKFIMCRVFGARDWGNVNPHMKTTLEKVLAEPDFRDKLPKIKTPILLLWGEQDAITPIKSGKVFANKLPNNQIKTFDTGRHGIHYTHENEIVKYVSNFLKEK